MLPTRSRSCRAAKTTTPHGRQAALTMRPLLPATVLIIVAGVTAAQAVVPDPTLTPGSIRTEICSDGTRQFRRAHDAIAITQSYSLSPESRLKFEIDHLIPLELRGADDLSNLWPEPRQSIEPVWCAEAKDELREQAPCPGLPG
jgi:hypothetical protein